LVVERDGQLVALPVVLERRVLGIGPDDWPRIGSVTPQSSAWAANLQSGDLVVDVEEAAVGSFEEFVDVAGANAGAAVALTVERDGQRYLAEVGVPSEVTDQGLLGVLARADDPEPAGLVGAVPVASEQFVELSTASVGALMAFFSPSGLSGFAENVVTTPPGGDAGVSTSTATRTAGGALPPLPEPSRSNLTDENRVLSIVGIISLGSEMDLVRILFLVALVNIFLAIFNLIPLLPFDGGHILVATYDRVREGLARRRVVGARLQDGRYCADFAKLVPLTYAVVGLIVAVGLGALWLDVIDPPSLSG
jgi:membrane-associated protease RseP (regulator of RpoE activity)